MISTPTNSSDWDLIPMSEHNYEIRLNRSISIDEYRRIILGFKPEDAWDERWFIYHENNILFIHYATGPCVFQVEIKKVVEGYLLDRCRVNAEANLSESKSDWANWIIDHYLLGSSRSPKPWERKARATPYISKFFLIITLFYSLLTTFVNQGRDSYLFNPFSQLFWSSVFDVFGTGSVFVIIKKLVMSVLYTGFWFAIAIAIGFALVYTNKKKR
jgi:hypothetical protein